MRLTIKRERHSPTPLDDQPDFGSLLENFRDACDHLAPEDALDCSGCGGYPPDDPIMTSCLCVYCTECFTELLAKTDRDGGSSTIPCPAYPDEEIEYYKTLTPGEFEALLSIFAHHTRTDETFKMPFTAKVQEIPDDVEVLWRSRGAGKVSAHRCGDHSRTSPELGDDSMELSSDGFDGASRSTGYENDSSSETASQLGLISASIGLVDPRHDANEDDVPFSDEENLPCLRVSSDEMGELGINMNGWDGSPQDATTPAHIVSTHAPHIDLTRSDDAQQGAASHSEVASEKSRDSDDESEEEGVEDDDEGDADEGDLCECYDCMGTF